MNVKGNLDRIVDGKHAVIIVEELGKEFVVDVERLPTGSKEGAWFNLTINDDTIESIVLDEQYTAKKEKDIENKVNKLRKRSSGSRFQRK